MSRKKLLYFYKIACSEKIISPKVVFEIDLYLAYINIFVKLFQILYQLLPAPYVGPAVMRGYTNGYSPDIGYLQEAINEALAGEQIITEEGIYKERIIF